MHKSLDSVHASSFCLRQDNSPESSLIPPRSHRPQHKSQGQQHHESLEKDYQHLHVYIYTIKESYEFCMHTVVSSLVKEADNLVAFVLSKADLVTNAKRWISYISNKT